MSHPEDRKLASELEVTAGQIRKVAASLDVMSRSFSPETQLQERYMQLCREARDATVQATRQITSLSAIAEAVLDELDGG